MADSNAAVVQYMLESAAFAGSPMRVRHVRHDESLSEPYVLTVSVTLSIPDADPTLMLGKDAALTMTRGGSERRVVGVVERVSHDVPYIELTVVPALRLLDRVRDSRIFQEQSVPEILEAVLGEALGPYNRSVRQDLNAAYLPREYCVQYQETNLDFVHRLMEEEGIHYSFEHEGEQEVMVLRDVSQQYPEISSGALLPYDESSPEITGAEPIHRFEIHHRANTSAVAVRDWDWTRGGTMLVESSVEGAGKDARVRESYEHGEGRSLSITSYDQGVRRYQEDDAAPRAEARQEGFVHDDLLARGISRAVALNAGVIIELSGHPTVGADGRYLVTRVQTLSGGVDELIPGFGATEPYVNRFECIPEEAVYRPPRRARKPTIEAMQTAVVTGPSGEEIHVDEHGRIKVQFHWDRQGANDEHSSCWIRVQQPWAGAGWGFWWVPRMGMEVVVHFVDGDPDRPLITGSVYDGANPLPYPLPDEKTKSTIKSNSSLGGGGSNEFRFEDKAGSEEIYTHAQKDYNELVLHDHDTLVHNCQTITVDNDQTQIVKNDQTETVHGEQTMTVVGNRSVTVTGNYDEKVDGTETRGVTGDVTESFESNETRKIMANVDETIGANETRTVGSSQTETIGANLSTTIGGSSTEKTGASLTETVIGGITAMTPAQHAISATAGFNAVCGAGIMMVAGGPTSLVAAGGATNADQFFVWNGGAKFAMGGISYKAVALKIDMTLVSLGVTNVKMEDSAVELSNDAVEIWNETLNVNQKGMEMQLGAVEIHSMFKIKS